MAGVSSEENNILNSVSDGITINPGSFRVC